ncbi:MAG: pilus assembly protein TadG-related protein [Ilumatobacteraceae bacterium]
MQSDERDRGQAVVLLLAVVVMAALSVIAIGRFGSRVIDRGRAQTAADAAALAATSGGRPAVERLAGRNGGRLISYEVSGDSVVVVVDVAGERAVARATDGP